jgi:threonine/homoserine/homoserine lactone efflux protein
MLHTLLTFVPVAALLSVTPGAATALVVRNAARGGRRYAFFTTSGNSIGVLAWGCFAAVGIATVVAASAAVFDAVKLAGAAVLKLAVFFVALFLQFIPRGAAVLPSALAMAAFIVAVDLVWYSTLALLVARARKAFVDGGWGRRVERLTGVVLIGLGIRLALERR